jgi:RNA polymerase sigma-70 factor, ECF subfamily
MTTSDASRQVRRVPDRVPDASPAFRDVFEENFDYVWNTLRHLGARTADLEDLAQEVFVRVHERFDEYEPSRPVRPWLFAFAFRLVAGHRRLARNRVETIGLPKEPAATGMPADEQMVIGEDRALALAALGSIDVERRAVFVLHELDEVPIPQVADALGIPTNTAYSRLRVARKEFAAAAARLRRARGER